MTTEKKKGSECNLEAPTTSENNCILYSAVEPEKQANGRMVDHALAYAARGWHVFPAHSSGEKKSHKSAQFSNGRAWGATTNATQIKTDFARWPHANIGIVTGPSSGFFVVEADTPEGHDVDGVASLQQLEAKH